MNFCKVLVEVPFESCPCISFELKVNQIRIDGDRVIEAYKCKYYESCKNGYERYSNMLKKENKND